MRTTSRRGFSRPPRRIAKKSVSRTMPEPDSNVVASTRLSPMYSRRLVRCSRGRIAKWPPRPRSSSRAKQLSESKRGKQHQSIEPSRETSAAEWQSPINA